MFKCKICAEKDRRIVDLQEQVAYLRELANPSKLNVQIPAVHAEADQILSATATHSEDPSDEEEILSERVRLLSGTF